MTTRIDRRFAALKQEGRAALVTFTMAGDPDYDTSLAIAKALPKAGADVIELGMPFTDPMADGPAIQAAGVRALKGGQRMTKTLALDGRPFDIACGQIDIGNALTEMAAPMTTGVPQANGTIAAEAVMDVRHVADAVVHMAGLPLDANVLFMTVMATRMPYVGRG